MLTFILAALRGLPFVALQATGARSTIFTDPNSSPQYLTVSAVVSDSKSGNAEIQCWRFKEPFYEYPTVGKALQLGDTANMTYVVLPPQSNEGLHHPPHYMFFVLLAGVAHVTLPAHRGDLWIVEGINPLIVATDVDGSGHYTSYPSETESVALQIPFASGRVPEHDVLFHEACPIDEQALQRKLRNMGVHINVRIE